MATETNDRPQDESSGEGGHDQDNSKPPPEENGANKARKRVSLFAFVGILVIGAIAGLWYYIANRNYEDTDDAFIAGNVYQIAPKVEGRIETVSVRDNQNIAAGDVIAEIEPKDFDVRVAQAQAALELAKAQARQATVQVGIIEATTAAAVEQANAQQQSASARLEQERAGLESAQAEEKRAQADLARYTQLSDRAVSAQRLDLIRSTATTSEAQVRAAQKRVASAQAEVAAAKSQVTAAQADRENVAAAKAEVERREAEVRQAQAMLDQAQLNLSYCKIVAPAAGRVTNKAILPGDYVKVGQSLLALVSPNIWVLANFKETQLQDMRPGQPVTIHVDAYDADFPGHVDSIQAGSGAQFSLLPPQNATGNYVKVVQRVPVKILFDQVPDPSKFELGPGMSVEPKVKVRGNASRSEGGR